MTDQNRPLLDFVVAGAWKSGSTALWSALAAHPGIEPCLRKEPSYFDRNYQAGPVFFEPLFAEDGHGLRGEASVGYMVDDRAPARMGNDIPEAKLIFVLREPVARAISHFNWRRAIGKQPDTWASVIAHGRRSPVIDASSYGFHLDRFRDRFSDSQILVVQSEAYRRNPSAELDRVASFLDVEPFDAGAAAEREVNPSKVARSDRVARLLARSRDRLRDGGAMHQTRHPWLARADRLVQAGIHINSKTGSYPAPTVETLRELEALFTDDVRRLAAIKPLDLDLWART